MSFLAYNVGALQILGTVVYGADIHHYRRLLWSDLKAIAVSHSHILWIVMGDFNTVRFTQEKLGGRQLGIHQL